MSAFISRYLIQIKRIAAHVNIRVVGILYAATTTLSSNILWSRFRAYEQ